MNTATFTFESLADLDKTVMEIFSNIKKPPALFLLTGHPGAGKTSFVKAVGKLMEIEENVTSPSFNIMNSYKGRYCDETIDIIHIDYYRVLKNDTLVYLDFFEMVDDENYFVFIEWPQNVNKEWHRYNIPVYTISIETFINKEELIERKLSINEYKK